LKNLNRAAMFLYNRKRVARRSDSPRGAGAAEAADEEGAADF